MKLPAITFIFSASCSVPVLAAPSLPPGFTAQEVGISAGWDAPVGLAIAPDGRLFVVEKRGRVYIVQDNVKLPEPYLEIEQEVLNDGDRGLLGITLDPQFAANGFVYLVYTVDPDEDGVDGNVPAYGRLTRYNAGADNPNVADPASRRVLLGETWVDGIPAPFHSHAPGSVRFGEDGTLLLGAGEGAHADVVDVGGRDAGGFGPGKTAPAEDRGAFRSLDLNSLAGKILRLDPATGAGLPSNPFFTGDPSANASRVWAYGLRNPFRFAVKPGSGSKDPAEGRPGTLYIADVGWLTWEEVNVCSAGGQNFGWPCVEGPEPAPSYPTAAPSGFDCTAVNAIAPFVYWHHSAGRQSIPSGWIGKAATGIAFYTGSSYPVEYQGGCFVADYDGDWIRVLGADAGDAPLQALDFATGAQAPVDIVADPVSGDLFYLALQRNQIRRLRYDMDNRAPSAFAIPSRRTGDAPLSVEFTAEGSGDPDGDALTYFWSFGDGSSAVGKNPIHVFERPGVFNVTLTADDGNGGQASYHLDIAVTGTAGGAPPVARILAPARDSVFLPRAEVALHGTVLDPLQPIESMRFQWEVIFHHNSHVHPNWFTAAGQEASFLPSDHDDGTGIWLEIVLRVTGEDGLTGVDRVEMQAGEPTLLDNGDLGTWSTGSWVKSSSPLPHGATSLFSKLAGSSYIYDFRTPAPGSYDVYAWWTTAPNRSTAAPYEVWHAGGIQTVLVDQQGGGDRWNHLGRFQLEATARVTVSCPPDDVSVCADAVCLLPAPALPPPAATPFRRADVDADGHTNVTDVIVLLVFLFQGSTPPPCLDSGDNDDSGSLGITDPIYLLGYLFSIGPAPPEPFTSCGVDSTASEVTCEAFPPCR